MFRHRQPLRRWAALVLLLWLFGVGTGVAHACLAPSLAEWGEGSEAAAAGDCHGAGQTAADERAAGKTNCQDFCDKAGVSIPPLKAALDDVLGAALLFPAVAAVAPVPALAPVQAAVPRRDGGWAPPIRIALLRLTL
jgi:hypothetical protein